MPLLKPAPAAAGPVARARARGWPRARAYAVVTRAGPMLALLAAAPLAAAPAASADDDSVERRWAATLGFVASYAPEYAGGENHGAGLIPGGAIRYGRVSIASRSAFAVRGTAAGAQGGLRVDLSRGRPWRASLGLRWDSGRDASDSDALRGLGDVRATLLTRLNVSMPLGEHWRVRGAVAVDTLGRGSGVQGDFGLGRDFPLGAGSALNLSGTLAWSGGQHMRAYFGVTPVQSAASGYPVYSPGGGLREFSLSLGLRTPLDRRWTLFGSASASHLLGEAADSPLTRRAGGWGMTLGTVYRF
jgi:outer membrane scaffolding protein for murein synthesis (MipA/OmpV family)